MDDAIVKCAECECTPAECNRKESSDNMIRCTNCTKEDKCCCLVIHIVEDENHCCNGSSCKGSYVTSHMNAPCPTVSSGIRSFFSYAKGLYAAALGIEILCIAAAEIGENTGLYLFGFNASGIAIAYAMGYALAGFTTFVTILGRDGS